MKPVIKSKEAELYTSLLSRANDEIVLASLNVIELQQELAKVKADLANEMNQHQTIEDNDTTSINELRSALVDMIAQRDRAIEEGVERLEVKEFRHLAVLKTLKDRIEYLEKESSEYASANSKFFKANKVLRGEISDLQAALNVTD